ncbi:MAG TPA: hypothetical protein PLL67_06735, partial [Gammaproteobacteria bacterium]|nr:hypothetical protein [Gammaproteobacteria bacterium]
MNSSILAKFKQWQIALILLVVILIISGIVLYMLSDKPKAKKILDTVSVQMTSGGERLNAEKLWREKMEDEQKIFKKG